MVTNHKCLDVRRLRLVRDSLPTSTTPPPSSTPVSSRPHETPPPESLRPTRPRRAIPPTPPSLLAAVIARRLRKLARLMLINETAAQVVENLLDDLLVVIASGDPHRKDPTT